MCVCYKGVLDTLESQIPMTPVRDTVQDFNPSVDYDIQSISEFIIESLTHDYTLVLMMPGNCITCTLLHLMSF